MHYKITLLNNSTDQSTADIALNDTEGAVQFHVSSTNKIMKQHLDTLLKTEYYSMSPGLISKTDSTVCVLKISPFTREYFALLPEILGWKGYKSEVGVITKSVDDDFIIFKSEAMYNNTKGERIVKMVPAGMMAVNVDGRTVMGGRYLNANIDKEGATWSLVENPHENQTADERLYAKSDAEFGMTEYHPGMDEKAYSVRETEEDQTYHMPEQEYKAPASAQTLTDYYKTEVQEVSAPEENKPPMHLPTTMQPGYVIYSPSTGIAVLSENWPPTSLANYGDSAWYIFDAPDTDDESELADLEEILGPSPSLARGLKAGPVDIGTDLDVTDAPELRLDVEDNFFTDEFATSVIEVNKPLRKERNIVDLDNSDIISKIAQSRERISEFKKLTDYRETPESYPGLDPRLEDLNVPYLKGTYASMQFELRPEQKSVVLAMTDTKQYESFGGPEGYHGYYNNSSYGLGKSAMICAADAIMRNRGDFESGTQVTLVTAPTKNIHVWASEIAKFRGEGATVVDGARGDRIAQWEKLLEQSREGELPNFVVVAGSKFRLGSDTVEDDDGEEKQEIDIDAQYMRLMALGGKSNGKAVAGGHIAALVLDETSKYVNMESTRYAAVKEIADSVYHGKGLVWMLNGDLSDNSATDTISQLSLINDTIRQDLDGSIQRWTKPDRNRPNSASRVWKTDNGELQDFNAKFGHTIYTLDGKTAAGDEYGMAYTPPSTTPLGKNWGTVYSETLDKMEAVLANVKGGKSTKALGMLSILINSSFGAVNPQRLLEYDVGTNLILKSVKTLLDAETYADFEDELRSYLLETTEQVYPVGRLPKDRLPVNKRDETYNRVFSATSKQALEVSTDLWDNPIIDSVISGVRASVEKADATGPVKLGVSGFSKRFINNVYRRLKDEYEDHKVMVMKFDGDTDGKLVQQQMQQHQDEDERNVISLVTSAGLYGLSLPAARSWGMPNWNPGKSGQFTGRFHRSPKQSHLMTALVPSGAAEYMREVEDRKKNIQKELKGELLDFDFEQDEDGELTGSGSVLKLMDKLQAYYPKILEKESRDL